MYSSLLLQVSLIMDEELDSMDYKNIDNPKVRVDVFKLIENLDLANMF